MTDIVVTIPRKTWPAWLAHPNVDRVGGMRSFHVYGARPSSSAGDLLYVLAHRKIRCRFEIANVAPLRGGWFIQATFLGPIGLSCPEIRGFQNWRRRWWDIASERPFPDWKTAGVFLAEREDA